MSYRPLYICLLLLLGVGAAPRQADAQVSFQVFYDELSPYGTWVDDPEYGYIWIPGSTTVSGLIPPTATGR